MNEQTSLLVLLTIAGLAWTSGGLLQWLTLRKQERLIQELRRHEALLIADEKDSVLPSRRSGPSTSLDDYITVRQS